MQIANAIRGRNVISFLYHGKNRVVEPHTYGIDGKGHKALRAYQIGGNASERIPCWRIFHESEMLSLSVSAQKFAGPRPEYNPNDPAFATILAQL
jgi:predicted DNA-binding transcriptional regulator YafY